MAPPDSGRADEDLDSPGSSLAAEVTNGFDWLPALLIAALLIVVFAQARLSINSIAGGIAALVIPIASIVATVGAVRRFWSSDRTQVERLKILERVLGTESNDSDPYLKRRALEAVIAEGQAPTQGSKDLQPLTVSNVFNDSIVNYALPDKQEPKSSGISDDA
jgi:hypothetical protein